MCERCQSAGPFEATRALQRGTDCTETGGALRPEGEAKYQHDRWLLIAALSSNVS